MHRQAASGYGSDIPKNYTCTHHTYILLRISGRNRCGLTAHNVYNYSQSANMVGHYGMASSKRIITRRMYHRQFIFHHKQQHHSNYNRRMQCIVGSLCEGFKPVMEG